MPVTVKIEDKERKRVAADAPPPAQLSDYAVPNERSEGFKAFLLWVLIMVSLSGGFMIAEVTRPIGIGLFVWWIVSVLIFYVLAPRMVLRRLRLHGADFEINSRKTPRLKTVLSKGSALLGISEPEGFLTEDSVVQVRITGRKDPYFLVVTKGACNLLAPPELDCLALRAMMHGRQGHVGRLMLIQFLYDTPAAARILVWPAAIYATLLQLSWSELALQTADRLTLLLLRDHKLLLRSILKLHSVSDPIMVDAEVTPEDVEAYVNQEGRISMEGREISTQYKIGSAISANPFLDERIRALNEWSRSQEYKDALQKLAEARAKNTPVRPAQ
jgi:hypothetical protein